MTFKPTNVYQRMGHCAAGGLDAELLRVGLGIDECWTRPLLLEGFEPDDVLVRVDADKRAFWLDASSSSLRQPDDFNRLRRCVQLPDEIDVDTVRCWMDDGVLMLIADFTKPQQQQQQHKHPQAGLIDLHACLVKDKSVGGARWQLELAMPQFNAEEISVSRDGGRVIVEAEHSAAGAFAECRETLRRELPPPTGVQLDQLVWRFDDGILRLQAPAPGLKVKKVGRIATLTRDLRHGPTFQERSQCVIS